MSSLIPFLRRVGVSSDQILQALELQCEETKARNRAKVAKWRINKQDATNVTVTAVTPVTQRKAPTPPKETTPCLPSVNTPHKRGARLPEGWKPSENLWTWGKTLLPEEALRFETGAFRDHFWAAPGQKGVKIDWDCTWKNWMREAVRRRNRAKPVANGITGGRLSFKPELRQITRDEWRKARGNGQA